MAVWENATLGSGAFGERAYINEGGNAAVRILSPSFRYEDELGEYGVVGHNMQVDTPSGYELIANGTFDTNLDGWTQEDGSDVTASAVSGRMRLVRTTGDVAAFMWQAFQTVEGETYSITGTIFTAAMSVRVGTEPGNGSMLGANTNPGALNTTFEASGDVAYISLWPVNNSSTSEIDNISVKRQ